LLFLVVTYISPFRIRIAAEQLRRGAILAYPTEAVYGLGCDPLNEDAVLRLLRLKQRPMSKGLILAAANLQQLAPFLRLNAGIIERCSATGPGPVTWVVPTQDWVPEWLTGEHRSLAVRVSAHPCIQQLCMRFGGPVVSTSANPGGKVPALNAQQVRNYFPREVSIFTGDTGGLQNTTPIYDAVSGRSLR
jgi:L-threonylcarbamoyladenylate synthase